jgi:hypothetical protein
MVLLLLLGAHGAAAQAAPRVVADTGDYRFAESMTFTLQADSASPIRDIVLRYTIGGEGPVNRRIPTFTPGTRVEARDQEDVARGEIPPASVVTWWWTLTDDEGRVTETPPQSFRYLDQQFDWQSTDGADVRVWWYDQDRAFADGIAERARAALARLERLIGAPANRRIDIVVYGSQADMRPALAARGSTYEARLATLGARVAPDILVLDAGTRPQDLGEVIDHELSHILLHLRFGHDYLDTATWLDEGLAMYSEGPLSADEQADLDAAVKHDELMSVQSLTSFPGEADLVPLAYAESRDIVAFLLDQHGEAVFGRLIDVIAAGEVTTDEALQQVYGFDQLGLYQAYRAHLGLAPAVTPAPGTAVARRTTRRPTGAGAPCAAVLLTLPALALAVTRRRRP